MYLSLIFLLLTYLLFRWSLEWIKYYNGLDKRFENSLWRWSYDYPVIGKKDISMLDDKKFVLLRRKRNKAITLMYSIFFAGFVLLVFCVNQILLRILH